jgi:ubiquinone biosynthesis protein UbiJ
LARPADVRQFLADVDQLRDDLARLDKRIGALPQIS